MSLSQLSHMTLELAQSCQRTTMGQLFSLRSVSYRSTFKCVALSSTQLTPFMASKFKMLASGLGLAFNQSHSLKRAEHDTHRAFLVTLVHAKRNKLMKNSFDELHFNCVFLPSDRVSFPPSQRAIKQERARNWSRKFFVFNFGELLPSLSLAHCNHDRASES